MRKVILYTKEKILSDTYIFRVKPVDNQPFSFCAGQFVYIKNPAFHPDESRPFSIASSPFEKKHLEFCIKVYGKWTQALTKVDEGQILEISSPIGNFIWDDTTQYAVFLLGGIGISPIMSMLRTICETGQKPTITLLYGNRTPKTIAYKSELQLLSKKLPLHIVDIFSDIPTHHPWSGYRGFITKEIIQNEVKMAQNPTWFVIGPPIFIEKMLSILGDLSIPKEEIKTENIAAVTNA